MLRCHKSRSHQLFATHPRRHPTKPKTADQFRIRAIRKSAAETEERLGATIAVARALFAISRRLRRWVYADPRPTGAPGLLTPLYGPSAASSGTCSHRLNQWMGFLGCGDSHTSRQSLADLLGNVTGHKARSSAGGGDLYAVLVAIKTKITEIFSQR